MSLLVKNILRSASVTFYFPKHFSYISFIRCISSEYPIESVHKCPSRTTFIEYEVSKCRSWPARSVFQHSVWDKQNGRLTDWLLGWPMNGNNYITPLHTSTHGVLSMSPLPQTPCKWQLCIPIAGSLLLVCSIWHTVINTLHYTKHSVVFLLYIHSKYV